jgi:hypothetical protein
VASSGQVWRIKCETESSVTRKPVHCMTKEGDIAVAYDEIVVDRNKLISGS